MNHAQADSRAERGFLRVMPYKAQPTLNPLGGITALSAPWLLGFSQNARARNTFLVMGTFGLIAGLLSEPQEMPADEG